MRQKKSTWAGLIGFACSYRFTSHISMVNAIACYFLEYYSFRSCLSGMDFVLACGRALQEACLTHKTVSLQRLRPPSCYRCSPPKESLGKVV